MHFCHHEMGILLFLLATGRTLWLWLKVKVGW